ncbi:MAG: sigma-54 dependent transcriptional regulator [Thermoanaerobaculia bacterium]|nr:sigma-54 dependent transcriptional regulator [Thermoanaerobaculia bacterium]
MHLLIVDDEASLRDFLTIVFEEEGWNVTSAGSVAEGTAALCEIDPDLVLCDLMMPDGSGLEILKQVHEQHESVPVVMITAYTSAKSAVAALKAGAYDYIAKPFDIDELKIILKKAVEHRELEHENIYLRQALEDRFTFSSIIGKSRRMQEIFRIIERIAGTTSTVLITGESGTGKELVAKAIHAHSKQPGPFVSINCGALPETLLESELFGHEKGAFTGAIREKKGLFQEADRGTLFLDEISEMSSAMQIKLLRVLQERTIRRVGGNTEIPVNVRVIAATNRDLSEAIQHGEFREDLFYRINVIPIVLPALRERREDIPMMVEHFIEKFSEQMGVEPKKVSVDAMEAIESHSWPGNVRELENVIERVVALDPGDVIRRRSLPEQVTGDSRVPRATLDLPPDGLDLETHLEEIGKTLMVKALERTGGVQKKAAKLLGMSFRSFRYHAKKYDLDVKEIRKEARHQESDVAS